MTYREKAGIVLIVSMAPYMAVSASIDVRFVIALCVFTLGLFMFLFESAEKKT